MSRHLDSRESRLQQVAIQFHYHQFPSAIEDILLTLILSNSIQSSTLFQVSNSLRHDDHRLTDHRIIPTKSTMPPYSVNANARTLTPPAAPQTQSLLLRLPAELKVKVLRNLMKRNTTIRPMSQFKIRRSNYPEDYAAQVQLSSQLLSTCQQLLAAGAEIL